MLPVEILAEAELEAAKAIRWYAPAVSIPRRPLCELIARSLANYLRDMRLVELANAEIE